MLFAFPVVEFVDVADRLPHLHPGFLASGMFVAVLVFMVVMAYRWTALRYENPASR